jgi:mitochondrial fission protein ELM1
MSAPHTADMDLPPRVWALLDDRAGNNAQTLGIAEALGYDFTPIKLDYTALVHIPNALQGASLRGVTKTSKARLKIGETPDIIIAAGRRLAPIALSLKKHFPKAFLIHLMHPDTSLDNLNLVILPEHDHPAPRHNILTSLGAPHAITAEKLSAMSHPTTHPSIALLIGGDSKHGTFAPEEIDTIFAALPNTIHLNITTSRRTSVGCLTRIRKLCADKPHTLYAYGDSAPNPYPAMLGNADAIIVTGDSVAMCSESCATGKPVFIYIPHKAAPLKHRLFIQSLYDKGYAKPLKEFSLNWQPQQSLQEAKRLAPIILECYSLYKHKLNNPLKTT